MKQRMTLVFYTFLCVFALFEIVHASDGSFDSQFLGSPLLVLVALIVIDVVAFVYHKIRK